ncbi:sigma-70 family RNA polymerase sigma factor [Erwinia pyri]|uniref:Sigma-70 family RNA polymerase sigma factor n=1 Tax=Erwinia pyri TaxID=3062598 RepID=A0AA50DKJ4_9GAMM|nr:sigma-70 family RNA polymerase sigma factor [Erwinia sp. DE2]WLS77715.1 sigma-70 family RNA polymerase sigma factor [Erwinia sp. DE2]
MGNSVELRTQLPLYLARLWRYGLVLSRKRDVAEDLVQATCVRALEKSSQFVPGTRLDRWLFTLLHSIWINQVRATHLTQQQNIDELDGAALQVSDGESDHLWAQQVRERINRLPEAQRNAVFLVYVEGFTYQEAAETLAVPIGTIMSRLANARHRLAKAVTTESRHNRGGEG